MSGVIERPILFSGAMVRANLRQVDPKRQTRRVMKNQPPDPAEVQKLSGDGFSIFTDHQCPDWFRVAGPVWAVRELMNKRGMDPRWICPYGKPGDRLWVRETWCPATWGSYEPRKEIPRSASEALIQFRADFVDGSSADYDGHWKPSIHMPRWASRLTLEIVKVRVERVQDISEAGAIAEGTPRTQNEKPVSWGGHRGWYPTARDGYRDLWDSINAKRDGGIYAWARNPWVWVIEYKRLEGN